MDTLTRPAPKPAPRHQRPPPPLARRSAAPRPASADLRRRLVRASLRGRVTTEHRPDIEGMRAVAVIAVVLFHARLLGLPGGFVGVDVFFVVSGFLITRLLLRDLETTGTVRLGAFWARRARRLLPASTVVVLVTLLVGRIVLPPLSQTSLGGDAVAAGTFTSNLRFADRLGDYFGAQLGALEPSPLLHFWTLAVEEQFYLCWPLLLLALTRRPRQYRRLLLSTVVALTALGFLLSAWMTPRAPAAAFYLLPARSGELFAGAALAGAGPAFRGVRDTWRAAAGWLGLVGIAVAIITYDETMSFPGTATILPVGATLLVIIAGEPSTARWAPLSALRATPLQWIGRRSYAIYLWHWPVFVLAEAHWGPQLWLARVGLIGVAVALSEISLQLVEDPARHSAWLAAVPHRSLALGAACCLTMVAAGWWVGGHQPRLDGGTVAAAPAITLATTDPAALAVPATTPAVPGTTLPPPTAVPATTVAVAVEGTVAPPTTVPATLAIADPPQGRLAALVQSTQQVLAAAAMPGPVPSNLQPSLAQARARSQLYEDGCVNVGVNAKLQPCTYGVKGSERLMVLLGDSHAAQWFEALEPIATVRGYELVVLTKGGCPVATVEVPTPVLRSTCPAWHTAALAWLTEHQPDLVVATNSYTHAPADEATWAAGADAGFAALAAVVPDLLVLGDNPGADRDPPGCLSANLGDAAACATPRAQAIHSGHIAAEVAAARTHGATFVDTTDWFCTPTTCPAVVGNVLVLRDDTHLTVPAVRLVQPLLEAALEPHLA